MWKLFCLINLQHISVMRPQQSDSWGSQTGDENQKEERLVRVRSHLHITHANLLMRVGSFSQDRIRDFSWVRRQLAWGNSHKLQPGNLQHDRSKILPVTAVNSATSCPESVQCLQSHRPWKFTWAMLWARSQAGPALSSGGSRWHLGSLPTKIGL